jgi:hypothetical protein
LKLGPVHTPAHPLIKPQSRAKNVALAVNLKTAKTFDLTVPQSVLGTQSIRRALRAGTKQTSQAHRSMSALSHHHALRLLA